MDATKVAALQEEQDKILEARVNQVDRLYHAGNGWVQAIHVTYKCVYVWGVILMWVQHAVLIRGWFSVGEGSTMPVE